LISATPAALPIRGIGDFTTERLSYSTSRNTTVMPIEREIALGRTGREESADVKERAVLRCARRGFTTEWGRVLKRGMHDANTPTQAGNGKVPEPVEAWG